MKAYLSVDIEGVAGIAHWDEASKREADYAEFQDQMTSEAVAACEGALEAGATEVWIKDAHGTGRNIRQEALPVEAVLIRGWSNHPLGMVQELDAGFDGGGAVHLVVAQLPPHHPHQRVVVIQDDDQLLHGARRWRERGDLGGLGRQRPGARVRQDHADADAAQL